MQSERKTRGWAVGVIAGGIAVVVLLNVIRDEPNHRTPDPELGPRAPQPLTTGGTGLSERFEIGLQDGDEDLAGMVVCIDPAVRGKLVVCASPYDRTVAGVVAGGLGKPSGIVMSQPGTLASGSHEVVISGRVYCWVEATEDAVEVGDMLTTSPSRGFAMKARDRERALGATIGKALAPMPQGERGLMLVLVSLQ